MLQYVVVSRPAVLGCWAVVETISMVDVVTFKLVSTHLGSEDGNSRC